MLAMPMMGANAIFVAISKDLEKPKDGRHITGTTIEIDLKEL